MGLKNRISPDPSVLFDKTVIKNTRIPAELILEKLGNGYSFDSLIEVYPRITNEDILACVLFAADNSKHENILAFA
mgnify:CR=1 FL=1